MFLFHSFCYLEYQNGTCSTLAFLSIFKFFPKLTKTSQARNVRTLPLHFLAVKSFTPCPCCMFFQRSHFPTLENLICLICVLIFDYVLTFDYVLIFEYTIILSVLTYEYTIVSMYSFMSTLFRVMYSLLITYSLLSTRILFAIICLK